ncbi:MAG TPA: methyltransferase domain-containing protein [Acidimicrobiales bacterium]
MTDWDNVAPAWDRFVDEADEPTAAATARLVDALRPAAGDRVLELAAGPGPLAALWSELVGPAGTVEITDLSLEMVALARRRAELPNVEVAVLDASAIDRPDSSVDVVAVRMGLMFTPDPAVALAEIRRVLAPGGRLGALTWAGPEHNPWITCVGMAAMVNGIVAGGPPVGPGGIFSLGDPTQLEQLAERAGFADVTVELDEVTFHADSVNAHIDRVTALAGPLARALADGTPEQRAAVRRTAAELAAPHVTDRGVELPGRALRMVARR